MKELVLASASGLPPAVISPALAEMRQLLGSGSDRRTSATRRSDLWNAPPPGRCITEVAPRQPDTVIGARALHSRRSTFGNYTRRVQLRAHQDALPEELKVKRITGGGTRRAAQARPADG